MQKTNHTYTYAVGRRKSAVATVKLYLAKGNSVVNQIPVEKYFQSVPQKEYLRPFELTENTKGYYFQAKIVGGGLQGQIESLTLALSRALQKINTSVYTPLLKPHGLLTVDSRVKQRRMVGTGGKARRQKQSPKR